jgi:hypothetical protein
VDPWLGVGDIPEVPVAVDVDSWAGAGDVSVVVVVVDVPPGTPVPSTTITVMLVLHWLERLERAVRVTVCGPGVLKVVVAVVEPSLTCR